MGKSRCHFDEKNWGTQWETSSLLALNPGNQKARKFKAKILENLIRESGINVQIKNTKFEQ